MGSRDAIRVGLTVLLGVALLAGLTFILPGAFGGGRTQEVAFDNAQGLQTGAYVRVRGVVVGTVKDVRLGEQAEAVVVLSIRDGYKISELDDVRIVGGLMGFSPPYIEVTPGARKTAMRGPRLTGTSGTDVDTLTRQGERLLSNLNGMTERMIELTDSMAKVVRDPELQGTLGRTAKNFEKVSASSVVIAKNMESTTGRADKLVGSFQGTAGQLNRTMARADEVMTTFGKTARSAEGMMADSRALVSDTRAVMQDSRGVVKQASELVKSTDAVVNSSGGLVTETRQALAENRQKLTALFDNLNASVKQLEATLTDTRTFIGDQKLQGDLKATVANLKDATETLKQIGTDVRGITGDTKVQEDLRAGITNLRAVSEQASEVFDRVQAVLGKSGTAAKSVGQRIAATGIDAEISHATRSDNTRLDINATIPWSDSTFFRLGMYDFGESNRVNIQGGQLLRPGIWGRAGIHASKLGFGLDFGNPRSPTFGVDLWGIDRPQLDLRTNLPIARHLDITFGLDDAVRRPNPLIGLRYRR